MRIEALKYRTNNLDIIIFVDFDVLSGETYQAVEHCRDSI